MNDVKTIADMQAQIDTLRGLLMNLKFLLDGKDVDVVSYIRLCDGDARLCEGIKSRIIKLLELEEAKRYGIGQ